MQKFARMRASDNLIALMLSIFLVNQKKHQKHRKILKITIA